jgi:putative DNA primase/helicase
MDKPKVKDAARNCWKSVLSQLGIDKAYLTDKHGPCPICEDGKDRFRFDDKNGDGTWICSHCGSGDGIKFVMTKFNMDFREAAVAVEALLPGAAHTPTQTVRTEESERKAMNDVWKSGRRMDPGTVAGRYLKARTGLTEFCADIRAATSLRYFVPDSRIPTTHPGMIAMVRDHAGAPVNIHRTFLHPEGGKAKVESPRKCMAGGSVAGGAAIRLCAHDDILGIAEGIETALSATILHGVPCWAAVSAVGLEQWRPPQDVRVVIFADNDPSYTGHKAAYALAYRLVRERYQVEVKIPDRLGEDWNDVLRRQIGSRPETVAA